MPMFRKKPVVIEARPVTRETLAEVADWCGGHIIGNVPSQTPAVVISTLEGDMAGALGDFIIRGVQGEFYPCKPDIFEATYEQVSA